MDTTGKISVFIVDLKGVEVDVADRLAQRLNDTAYICNQYPGQRKYKVYWNLNKPIFEVIGCPPEAVHPAPT